jgi:hypothetical protein
MDVSHQQHETRFTPVTIEALRRSLSLFAQERQWEKFHTPRNLVLALVGEVSPAAGSRQQQRCCCSTVLLQLF